MFHLTANPVQRHSYLHEASMSGWSIYHSTNGQLTLDSDLPTVHITYVYPSCRRPGGECLRALRELTRLPAYPAGSQALDATEPQEAEELTVEQLSDSALLAAAVLATHGVRHAAHGLCGTC